MAEDVRARILVADDEYNIREGLKEGLERENYAVDTAEDGADGMGKLTIVRHPYDVIICDLEMPVMNGLQFVKRLRQMERTDLAQIPVLIVTGHSDEKNVQNAIKLGIQGFLIKPISKAAMEKRLTIALTGKDPGEEGGGEGAG